jgi:hypothetical protein
MQRMNTLSDILTMRSIRHCLCVCLLINNWLCLGLIYLFPKMIQSCIIQSYFLHVLTHFHFDLIVCLHLYWYYCLKFEESFQRLTYCWIFLFLLFIFICLCLLTLPSLSHQWASIVFDRFLQICIVDYTFNYSYTFFIFTLNCLIPFIVLCISHRHQMNNQIWKCKISKNCFQFSILLWSFLNIVLLLSLHIPMKYSGIRLFFYNIQIISFFIEPMFYIIINLLKSINEVCFL